MKNPFFKGLFLFLFIVSISNNIMAQKLNDTIQLPTSQLKSSLSVQDFKKNIKIYITSDYDLYIDDQKIKFWDDILPTIAKKNLAQGAEHLFVSHVIFYCDKRIKYRFVDSVKAEVARIKKKIFFYKVEQFDDFNVQANKVHGTVKEEWAGPIKNIQKEYFDYQLLDAGPPDWFNNVESVPNDEPRSNFAKFLYKGTIDSISRTIAENLHTNITLLPNKKYRYNGEIKSMDSLGELTHLLIEGNILMYRFDFEIDYEDYIYFLEKVKTISSQRKNHYESFGTLVEISFGLEEKLKEWALDIFK